MRFTLKQMRYVEAAGRTGSIVKAAHELNISQSSITAAIDALEAALGFDLFVRMPAKGIMITPAGSEALDYIRSFLEQARHLESDLRSIDGDPKGTLNIGCFVTTAPHVLPLMLKSFVREYPGISITIREGDLAAVAEMLLDGKVDVACTYQVLLANQQAILPPHLPFMPLFKAPPYAVIGSDDPLAERASVTMAELAARPMIMLDLPHTREYFLGLFEQCGLTPTIAHSTRSSEIVRAMVAGGFGISILNIVSPEQGGPNAGFVARPIEDELETPLYGVGALPGVRHPKIVRAFLDHCERLRETRVFGHLAMPV